MLLSRLARSIHGAVRRGEGDPQILQIAADSRKVEPGALFAALPGVKTDGADYIEAALARGARAVILPQARPELPVPQLICGNPRRALAEAANTFHGDPTRTLTLLGVTGTNGKTTVAFLLRHILRTLGTRTGLLGTVEYDTGGGAQPASLTTPGSVAFTRLLHAMVENGLTHAVVEVSSHALEQYRVWPHRFAGAVFTNLSRDHLDYHGDMDGYLRAKKILFDNLAHGSAAVVNGDDPLAEALVTGCVADVWRYAVEHEADIRACAVAYGLEGTKCVLEIAGERYDMRSPLVGRFNLANVLASAGLCARLGLEIPAVLEAIRLFPGVPGRLERFGAPGGVTVFVDYAHTPDALAAVLAALRPLTRGMLHAVFGCGGDRDRGKRPLMAQAAEAHADRVILTSDNPRTEEPRQIIDDALAGFRRPEAVQVLSDRREAVLAAVRGAGATDVVLVAGKGHEDYQIIGTERRHLDDRELVREACARADYGRQACA